MKYDWFSIADGFMGPIRRVVDLPPVEGEPATLHCTAAHVAQVGRFLSWSPDPQGSGCDFDLERARWAAVGEAAERYCGNARGDHDALGSYQALRDAGMRPVDPEAFNLYTREQLNTPGFPFIEPRGDVEYRWMRATEVRSNESSLVPQLAAVLSGDKHGEKSAFPTRVAGIAAGPSLDFAGVSGLAELIERDATARWWNLGEKAIEVPAEPIALGLGIPPEHHLRIINLRSRSNLLYVMAVVLVDEKDNIPVIGFAARSDPRIAIEKALGEAYQLRRINRALLQEDSWIWRQRSGNHRAYPLKPFRSDRSYMTEFSSPSQMDALIHNSQYYLDPSTHKAFWDRFNSLIYGMHDQMLLARGKNLSLAKTADSLEQETPNGIHVVDLTTEEFNELGLMVVRVLAPDLIPNYPQAFLPRAKFAKAENINDLPLPHA